jgi:hypothetical protein
MTPEEEQFDFKKRQAAAALRSRKRAAEAPQAAAPQTPQEIVAAAVPTREQMAEAARVQGQPMTDILTLYQRGAAYGQSPNIAGAASAAAGGSFEEGRQQMLEQERQAAENLTALGIPFGAIPEAAGGVMTGSAIIKPLAAAIPAIQGWLGTLLMGGAEGNVYAQGQGQDPVAGTLSGIAGSALGRAVATNLSKLTDMLPDLSVQRNTAQQIQEQAARAGVAPEDFIPTLQREVDKLGPSGALADIDMLRSKGAGFISPTSSAQGMAEAFTTAKSETRNVSDLALDEFGKIFPAPRTVGARGEAKQLTLAEAKNIYTTGLANTPVRFKPDPFTKLVNDTFGPKPIGTRKAAQNQLLSFINTKSPLGPDGKTRLPMKASDLLEIKDAIDYKIKDNTSTAVDKKTRADLIEISSRINDALKTNVPEIKDAAAIYSGQYAQDAGFEIGYDLAKKGLQNQSLADLREMSGKLTQTQKAALAEGYRQGSYEASDKGGAEKVFARVGPTKSNADLEIIDAVFGTDVGQKFFDASRRISAIEKTNKKLLQEWESVSQASSKPQGPSTNKIGQIVDLLTIGTQAATNKMMGGAAQGAIRREARAVGTAAKTAQADQALNWMTRTGTTPQTTEDAMQEIQRYLLLSQPSPLPQNLAAQAGRVGAAFERSGR